jgi:hypothetical protein
MENKRWENIGRKWKHTYKSDENRVRKTIR